MRRLAGGVLLAVIVHISVVLLWPAFVAPMFAGQFGGKIALHEVVAVDSFGSKSASEWRNAADPLFRSFLCRIDDPTMPVAIKSGDSKVPFWTASIYNRSGLDLFSANSGLPARRFHLIAVTAAHVVASGKGLAETAPEAQIVELPPGEAFVVVRAFEPDPTWSGVAGRFADALSCLPILR